ncbi:RxLR-like protein [Plasmopara halstedii]|uniref:RxLR-like protein n=1 Tax=Plasmopara halstedii TaxID=4781 RepID=A0A0P1ASH0_PLAHL|nr:RxLR-like protein [Plasmopara halstedii]CEG44730.1 RxLR-like protein [Plasmopara halstedii]|eukprot:XP_024581099.1 RxLR-like protein [Plasmopara halstedii]
MIILIVVLLLFAGVVAGFVSKFRIIDRLPAKKDHLENEDGEGDGVEVVVQKSGIDSRLKLALPDLSLIHSGSPIGPIKSSIRCALKELRSRQMVQSLCSRFESRLMKPKNRDASIEDLARKSTAASTPPTKACRRGERTASVVPVSLANKVSEAEIIADRGLFAKSSSSLFGKTTHSDADIDDRQPLLAPNEQMANADDFTSTNSKALTYTEINLELDLHTCSLQPEAEVSNQCDSSLISTRNKRFLGRLDATTSRKPFIKSSKRGTARNSKAFSLKLYNFDDVSNQSATDNNEMKPEICSDYSEKNALARFRQNVPSNGRRARSLAPLSYKL